MRTTTIGMAGRRPLRWRLDDRRYPAASSRRRELAAGLATAAVAGQLLFAQATLVSAAALVAVGRLSRWRPHWLAVPTAVSAIWLSATGPARAVAASAAGSQRLAGFLLLSAIHPRLLAHPGAVAAEASRFLPTGLPLALLGACGEAWFVLWLGWWRHGAPSRSRWQWRPGLVAAIRRRLSAAALAAGHTVTSDGCVIGVAADSGRLAGFSWAEAMHGVLLTGRDTDVLGLAITCAAFRRRKTVVILDCAEPAAGGRVLGGCAAVTRRVGELAWSLGVPVTDARGTSAAGAIGRAIRRRESVLITAQAADAARRAASDLATVLNELRDLGLRADGIAWINGLEPMDPASLAELLALGPLTGTGIVLSTTSSTHAADLASAAAVVAVGHPVGVDLGLALAARLRGAAGASEGAVIGREIAVDAQLGAADPMWRPMASARDVSTVTHQPGKVTMVVFTPGRDGSPRAITNCKVLPITVDGAQ
jgi:hypothetical protein